MGYENAHTPSIWQVNGQVARDLSKASRQTEAGNMTNDSKAAGFPSANGQPRIEILLVGMNGDLRGKQVPPEGEKKIWDGSVRLPSSTQSLDIWGDDNDDITGLSLSVGDPDGVCIPDPRSLTVMPWARHHARIRRHRILHGPARHSRPHGGAFFRPWPHARRGDGARILRR
jgi:hypothetical protein